MQLNKYMKSKRLQAGYTQQDVAVKLGYSTPQFVSNWERGVCDPPLKSAAKICRIFNIDREEYKKMILSQTERHLNKLLKIKK